MTNDWRESTEGDLDPDLTEEAGYSGWEPPRRNGWQLLYRAILTAVLLILLAGVFAVFLR